MGVIMTKGKCFKNRRRESLFNHSSLCFNCVKYVQRELTISIFFLSPADDNLKKSLSFYSLGYKIQMPLIMIYLHISFLALTLSSYLVANKLAANDHGKRHVLPTVLYCGRDKRKKRRRKREVKKNQVIASMHIKEH